MYRIRLPRRTRSRLQSFPSGPLLLGANDANGALVINPLAGATLVETERLYGGLYLIELTVFASVQADLDLISLNDAGSPVKTWRVPVTTREFHREYKITHAGGKIRVVSVVGVTGSVQASIHWERIG